MADERPPTARGDMAGKSFAEGRLPDARLADQHDQSAVTGFGGLESRQQALLLIVPPDEQ